MNQSECGYIDVQSHQTKRRKSSLFTLMAMTAMIGAGVSLTAPNPATEPKQLTLYDIAKIEAAKAKRARKAAAKANSKKGAQ